MDETSKCTSQVMHYYKYTILKILFLVVFCFLIKTSGGKE